MPLQAKIARLSEFTLGEVLLIMRLGIEAPFRRAFLHRGGFPHDALQDGSPAREVDAETRDQAQRLGRIVNIAVSRSTGPDNCLLRSLMLSRLLERRSIAHGVCFGAFPDRPFAIAHAWVEVGGIPVNDTPENVARFARFTRP